MTIDLTKHVNEMERARAVKRLAQEAGWSTEHFEVSGMLRALIKPLTDEGTGIDSGGGADSADLWFTIGGVEYYLNVRRSNTQLARDANGLSS